MLRKRLIRPIRTTLKGLRHIRRDVYNKETGKHEWRQLPLVVLDILTKKRGGGDFPAPLFNDKDS